VNRAMPGPIPPTGAEHAQSGATAECPSMASALERSISPQLSRGHACEAEPTAYSSSPPDRLLSGRNHCRSSSAGLTSPYSTLPTRASAPGPDHFAKYPSASSLGFAPVQHAGGFIVASGAPPGWESWAVVRTSCVGASLNDIAAKIRVIRERCGRSGITPTAFVRLRSICGPP
jgi:hypothetical protein